MAVSQSFWHPTMQRIWLSIEQHNPTLYCLQQGSSSLRLVRGLPSLLGGGIGCAQTEPHSSPSGHTEAGMDPQCQHHTSSWEPWDTLSLPAGPNTCTQRQSLSWKTIQPPFVALERIFLARIFVRACHCGKTLGQWAPGTCNLTDVNMVETKPV